VRADFWGPLPFGPGEFEAALALHGTLAHPPEPASNAGLARELARVVARGGVFVAEAPSPAWIDRVAMDSSSPDRRVRRTGPRACVYEDLVTGASIEARALDEAEWRGALAPAWRTDIEPLDAFEWLITARRA
jgi:hypothetical protein